MATTTVSTSDERRSTTIEEPTSLRGESSASQAFGAALDEYSQRGLRYAHAMLRSTADAEEVVQEAFCRLLLSRHPVEDSDEFAAVFFTTVRNLCVDVIRSRQRRPTMSIVDLATDSTESPKAEDSDELALLQRAIRDAIDNLPEQWSAALRLRIDGSLSYDKIARILNCSKAQVRTWIFRARRELERELAKQELLER